MLISCQFLLLCSFHPSLPAWVFFLINLIFLSIYLFIYFSVYVEGNSPVSLSDVVLILESQRLHSVVAVQMHVVLFWVQWFILITSFKALEDLSSHHFVEGGKKGLF